MIIRLPSLILLFCFVLLNSSASFATTNTINLFNQANEAYSRGDYQAAISDYSQIIESEGYAPAVLFNLANSYAQSGSTGKAILAYERAQRLAPSDADISGNLELVKKESGLFPKEPSKAERLFTFLTLQQWSLTALFSLAILAMFQLISLKYKFGKQTAITVVALSLLTLTLGAVGTFFQYNYFNPSVVIASDVRLLVSPFTSATSVGALQEGRLVYPQKHHNEFIYVTDETGRKGWIASSSAEAVVAKR